MWESMDVPLDGYDGPVPVYEPRLMCQSRWSIQIGLSQGGKWNIERVIDIERLDEELGCVILKHSNVNKVSRFYEECQ